MHNDVFHNGFNNHWHSVSNHHHDKSVFSHTANQTHWWNVTNWVPRGGRRLG